MNEEKTLKDEIKELKETLMQGGETEAKPKKFRSFKTILGKRKIKKGFLLVCEMKENKAVNIVKRPIIDGVVKLDNTFHAVSDLDIFFYQPILGKVKPMIFLPKNRINPWNPLRDENETYGQKHVMARMLTETIKEKKQYSIFTWVIVLLIIGVVIYYFATGGTLT